MGRRGGFDRPRGGFGGGRGGHRRGPPPEQQEPPFVAHPPGSTSIFYLLLLILSCEIVLPHCQFRLILPFTANLCSWFCTRC